jgi:DedD protein
MKMTGNQDTEITLGTGKILGLFFALVVFSAIVFGLGYSLGRTSTKPGAGLADASSQTPGAPATVVRAPGAKPATPPTDSANKPAETLTFFKAVGQKDANAQLAPAAANGAKAASTPPASTDSAAKEANPPDSTAAPISSSYYVQVAAVSKQEDADALVDALKKKQYPAFVANGSATDKLFRVQVGPYLDIKDAESVRGKLISDGYNPILKK